MLEGAGSDVVVLESATGAATDAWSPLPGLLIWKLRARCMEVGNEGVKAARGDQARAGLRGHRRLAA
jgi:hypothetical protein